MTNRRTKSTRSRRKKAPRESDAVFETARAKLSKTRSALNWAVLFLKFAVGAGLLVAAVVALAFGVHHYARTTPRFSVTEIQVVGTKRLVRQDVLRAAELEPGTNLFALNVEDAEKKLLESPWISRVRVTRRLPGTVRLEISEREAVAVAVIGKKSFLVDQNGEPFKPLGSGDPHDLPLVTGLSVQALAADRRAELSRLSDALALLRDYDRMSISRKQPAQEVHLEPSGGAVVIIGQQGTTLSLGLPPWKKKLLRAERVMDKTKQNGGNPSVLFLDNEAHPERVVVRIR